jgi:hypothetical protein
VRKHSLGRAGQSGHVDNSHQASDTKIKLRQLVMAQIPEPRVFDAFGGSGAMYSAVWRNAAAYAGCDQKPQSDERLMFCCDNRRVLRAIDLKPFNLFDLDAYGFPWEQAIIIGARRQVASGEVVGFCFTEGGGVLYKANGVPNAVTMLAGIKAGSVGLSRARSHIFDMTLAGFAKSISCEIVKRWQAIGKTGQHVIYCGVVLRGR